MLNDKINKIINDNRNIDKDQKISDETFGWSKKSISYMRDLTKMNNEFKKKYYYEIKNSEENKADHQKLVDYITQHPFGKGIRDNIHLMMDNIDDLEFILNVMKDYLTSMENNIDNYHGKDNYEERMLFESKLNKLEESLSPIGNKYHKILDEAEYIRKEYNKRKDYIKN